jgi:thioredoxin reductase
MSESKVYDVVIIGAGPGGYVAGTRAVSLEKTDKSVTVALEGKDGETTSVTAEKALGLTYALDDVPDPEEGEIQRVANLLEKFGSTVTIV